MSEWTPGPWEVESDGEVMLVVEPAKRARVCRVTWLAGRLTGLRRTVEEVHANARLIAAAPEMVESLRMIEEALTDGWDPTRTEYSVQAVNWCHKEVAQLLDKIEGGNRHLNVAPVRRKR